jgi:hypothetical protein
MWSWIIKVTMISLLLIFLLHYLYSFFKTTLTSPKLKDLVNKPQEKYNTIYNSLKSAGDVGIENVCEDNKSNMGGIHGSNSSSMKDELKKYLKELNVSNNSSSGALNTNTNVDVLSSNNEETNSIYSQNNIMTGVGANGISTRVNNIPNYLPNTNTSNPAVAPDYGTPSMSSSYSSAYSTY